MGKLSVNPVNFSLTKALHAEYSYIPRLSVCFLVFYKKCSINIADDFFRTATPGVWSDSYAKTSSHVWFSFLMLSFVLCVYGIGGVVSP